MSIYKKLRSAARKLLSRLRGRRTARGRRRRTRRPRVARLPRTRRLRPIRTSSTSGRGRGARPTRNPSAYTSAGYTPRTGNYDLSPRNRTPIADDGAIGRFGSELQSLLGEAKDVLKSLHGDFFPEKGYEVTSASRSAFEAFYDVSDGGSYTGLNRSWDSGSDPYTASLMRRTTEIVDVLVRKDRLPPSQLDQRMGRLNRETRTLSERGIFGTLGDPYIRRPGVGLILDVIEQADREIVVDLYQLQNRTVLDAIEKKVRDNPTIKLSVRLSLPDAGTLEQKGFDILGPNLLSLERLRRVKQELGVRGDIELFVQDRKSHQKVMVTDKFGIIGSFNLTAPAGYDPNQAGSNYEVVRRLQSREYSEQQLGRVPTADEEVLISSSDKLFRQLQESVGNRDALQKDAASQMRLGQGQVVGSAETYDHLRSTLDLMRDNAVAPSRQFYGILNQVFLLNHEDSMFRNMMQGEMGKFDSPSNVRAPTMRGIQAELLDLVIDNRAFLAVDNRNYGESVLAPMYERTKEIFRGTGLPTNSLEDLVAAIGYERENAVSSFMQRVEQSTGKLEGLNEAYTRQLLAMTSGNIRLTTVPMQHSKQYMVVDNGAAQSSYMGSANPGPYSMHAPEYGMDPREVSRTNREFGLAFLLGKVGAGPHALTQGELSRELELSRESFYKDWSTLTRTLPESVGGRPTSAWYEDKVDKVRLEELHTRLSDMTASMGAGEVSYTYGGRSGTERTGLSLTVDAGKLAGIGSGPTFRWDYTALSGGMGADEGYVLDVTGGRLISRSLIHNSTASNIELRKGDIAQGIGQDVLLGRANALGSEYVAVAPNKAAVINPIATTVSLVSTLMLESTNRLLMWGPQEYVSQLSEGERRTLVEKYLDTFTPGTTLMEKAGGKDRSNITRLLDTITRDLSGASHGKVRAWGSTPSNYSKVVGGISPLLSSMAYGYSMEEHIEYGLGGKDQDGARSSVLLSEEELVRRRVQRAGNYIRGEGGIVDQLLPLLDSSPEFRLAVVRAVVAETNPSYTEILTSGINALKGALMEPYLLSAQVSQYSGPQGWYRLPMYGVTRAQQELVDRLGGTPYQLLAEQAMAIPRPTSPYSSVGIAGMHRPIASGSNSEGTSVDTGLTVYGQRGMPVSTIMHHGVMSSMGIGFSTTREDVLGSDLSDESKARAISIFDEAGGDELLTYLFGGVGKVAQIPQRLKNTQGQRGLSRLSQAFREAVANKGDFLAIAKAYRKGLKQRLEERLLRANPSWTPSRLEQYIDRIIPEQDTVLAASLEVSVRGVMGGEQVAIIEAYKDTLIQLGLDPEDFEDGGLGYELVRIRALSADVMSTGMKGFTASPTYALLQMAGMYSDYFYANPLHSQLEGNLRTTTKKVKASMLGVGWTRSDVSGMELARPGDVVMFDPSLQKVIVVNHTTGTTQQHPLSELSVGDLSNLRELIDDRGQRSVLEGMVENRGREGGRSSVSTITTTGWNRPGEDSKEYLLSMRALPGGGRNQLFYEMTYVQALTPGGGRRVDSGTSLFKGVAVFLTESYFEGIAKNRRPDTLLGPINKEDIFGLINPSNLKSFSLEHGGSLLRSGKAEQVLASLGEREAAVAMLLAFGSNYMESPDRPALSTALYEAMRGMPGVYRETALQVGLRGGPDASGLLDSADKGWNPASMYSLMDIRAEDMLSSLRGGPGIKDTLTRMLSRPTKSSQYINVNDQYERQAATILTALDITRQLLRDERVTPGDVSMRSDVMEQLMSVVGLSEVPDEDIAQAMIRGLSQSVASVYLKMDLSYSSSKEPIGTKGTGALQNADLVKPFTQIAKEFSVDGDLSKLRAVLANMLVSTAQVETASSLMKYILPGDYAPIRSALDPQLFTPSAMSKNLGIYGSGMEDITALKKLYKEYGGAVQSAIEERVTAIASGGDVRILGSELSTLLFSSSDPTNPAVQSLLGDRWRPEYEPTLSSIQDVGRRYELLASKPFAVGEAEAIAREMGHERAIFHLPAIVFDPMPSESGRVVARIDPLSLGTSFYIPSAEDLRTYGIQYGSYTDELVRSTLLLASAYSPGTGIGNIFSTLSKVRAMGGSEVELTPEEVKSLQEYYVTAYNITERIAEASTGTRLKLEARTRGFVSTAAASFAVPQGAFLAAEEGMRGGGDVRDSLRMQRLWEVTDALNASTTKASSKLLRAEREALMLGMGEKGTTLLSSIYKDLELLSRNPQPEYVAARLWTMEDSRHVSDLTARLANAGTVEADRLSQEIRNYTRARVGSESVPNLPGVRSYRDIIGPRAGNEGNYYAVELGEQLLRSGLREITQERNVEPPTLDEYLRSKRIYPESVRRARYSLENQYVRGGTREVSASKFNTYHPDIAYTAFTVATSSQELPTIGILSRVLAEGPEFTGGYGDIELREGTRSRLRELKATTPKHLERRRREIDRYDRVYYGNEYQEAITEYENDRKEWLRKKAVKLTKLGGIVGRQQDLLKREAVAIKEWQALVPRTEAITTYMVGSEHYAVREQAEARADALGSDLRTQLDNALTLHKAGQWHGSIRGPIDTYQIDRSLFQGLGIAEGRELLSHSIASSKASIDQLLSHLSDVDSAYNYGPQERALVGRTELERLSTELGTLYDTRHEWTDIDTPLARMETLQASLNTADVLQATVFRSAPFGSTEIQRQQFNAIRSIGQFNEYLTSQGMQPLDVDRNKALSMVSSLSAITMNLNDFDGDPYTVIMSKVGTAMNDRQRLEDRLKANTLRMGMVRKDAQANAGEYMDEYIASITQYEDANTAISKRISAIDTEVSSLRSSLVETYDPLLRKEVASYLGISQSFFSEYQASPIPMEVLPTYLQQGRGLFGGIEGVAHKNSLIAMHATMEQIHATEDFQGTLRAIRDGAQIQEALSRYVLDGSTVLQSVSDDNFRTLLMEHSGLREDFLTRMVTSIQATPDLDPSASLMYGAAALSSSEGALSSYSKYMGMGSGASMTPTVYDMLTKTLGVAGSDILGKSYNSLVGTLFRDSPVIALSHVLSSNSVMEGMREYYAGTGQDVDYQLSEIHEEARRAESVLAFMKDSQQLLRDSIKFKGETNVLGELQRAHGEYEKYIALGDEASANTVLNDMAGRLGPGPGLRSYMQLNTLVGGASKPVYTSPLSAMTRDDLSYLSREYKIELPEAITRLTEEMRDRGYTNDPLVGDVIRYKVARDMRATITAFRYELGSNDNQPFLNTVWEGMRGFLGTPDRERGMEERFRSDPSLRHDMGAALTTDVSEWWESASSKHKALMLALVDEGRQQTEPIFGQVGEGLKDFVSFEVLRRSATALGGGRADTISGTPHGLMEADVSIALMNAAMGGKLSPESAATYMSVMADYLGSGSKTEDVLRQTDGGMQFLGMDRSDTGDLLRVIDTPGGGTRMGYADEALLPGESYRKLVIGGQEYDTPLAYVERAVEATSTGQRVGLLKDVAKAMTEQTMQGSKLSWSDTIQNALGASLPEGEILSATISRLQQEKLQQGLPQHEASRQALEEARDPMHMEETRRRRGMEMREAAAPLINAALRSQSMASIPKTKFSSMTPGASQANHMRHSQELHDAVGRMHDMNDMVIGAGLTLLGSLIATGSINGDTIGQVVGGTVSVLGYSQMGKPGMGSVLGQAFRARIAHSESRGSADEGEWVRRWVGREVGFYMGAALIAPAVMQVGEKVMSKFSPLRLDRPMDMDKYKGWKATANTIGGAVLSGVLGTVMSLIGGEVAVHGANLIPSLGVVESFVRSMSDTETRRQEMLDEKLAQVGEGTVVDGDGDPLRTAIEVSYVMDNPGTDFSAYPTGEVDYYAGDDYEVNVVG